MGIGEQLLKPLYPVILKEPIDILVYRLTNNSSLRYLPDETEQQVASTDTCYAELIIQKISTSLGLARETGHYQNFSLPNKSWTTTVETTNSVAIKIVAVPIQKQTLFSILF